MSLYLSSSSYCFLPAGSDEGGKRPRGGPADVRRRAGGVMAVSRKWLFAAPSGGNESSRSSTNPTRGIKEKRCSQTNGGEKTREPDA